MSFEELMKSWVFQKKGLIDHYNPDVHQGTQPVRVVNNMLVYMFGHSYPGFLSELKKQIDEGKLNTKIDFVPGEDAIRYDHGFHTPRVDKDSRMIQLHETFLSYLWCVTYAIFVLYVETIDYPSVNEKAGYEKHPVNKEEIASAEEMFAYAISLIAYYSPWDKDYLPNPEKYLAEKRTYPEQTNLFYTEAVKFILSHEYTHLKSHIDAIDENTSASHFLEFEYEADNAAIQNALKGADGDTIYAINCGIVIGIVSMFFFSANTGDAKHPDAEDRLSNALDQLPIDEQDFAWGMACIGLELWEKQFNLKFDWLQYAHSPKQRYYHLLEQIKKRK